MQASAKTRNAEWFGHIPKCFQYEQSTLVVVVEVHGRDYCYKEYFGITHASQVMGLVPKMLEGILNDAKSRYNLDIVHLVVPFEWLVLATPF